MDALDALATTDQFDTCSDQCEDFAVGTQADSDCTIDCYVTLDPGKFKIAAATQAEFAEIAAGLPGPDKK